MKVRPATLADVDALVAMAFRFYAESGYERIAPLQKEQAAGLILVCMQSGAMLVIERDDGTLAGMACIHFEPYLFNLAVKIAQEIAWWVEPDARGGMAAARLLKAAEQACRDAGCDVIRMATLPNSPSTANRMLEKFGYRPSESYFVKELA